MADDALGLFQSMRPQVPAPTNDIVMQPSRRVALPGTPDLHSLAMIPGTAAYNSRIPRPPCFKCGEDHVPNHDYGHPWEAEPVHDEPVAASAIMRRPAPAVFTPEVSVHQSPTSPKRVALYVGRGDTYVVSVETAPDWDAETTFKVDPHTVLQLVRLARALDIKVSDKTGGDLVMLEQEYGAAPATEPRRADRTPQTPSPAHKDAPPPLDADEFPGPDIP